MSDEPTRDQQPVSTPAGIWEHPCEHPRCDRWGGFGYSIAGRAPRWYCGAHRDDGDRLLGKG